MVFREVLMKKDLETIFSDGLQFFGNNNRLISHELKNVLAIISETLGLIEELIELNETGMKLDPGKLKSLSNSIIEEVSRANSIIRNMNAFAHSVDEFIGEVDLNQSIDLIIRLSQLDSSRKNTEILFNTNEKRILYTSPFFLGALISHAIDFAVLCAGSNRKIEISTSQDMHGLRIVFSGLEDSRILRKNEIGDLLRPCFFIEARKDGFAFCQQDACCGVF